MRDEEGKFYFKDITAILLVGIFLFVLFKYIEYRFAFVSGELDTANKKISLMEGELKENTKKVEDFINGTKENITNVLKQEQEKSNSLTAQFNEINNTVGALSKLSKIDPELLKKYSKVYFLNEHYIPVSLVSVDKQYISNKSNNPQVLSEIMTNLKNMLDASKTESLSLEVLSAYRSFKTQMALKSNYKITYGTTAANKFSADQGYSEHQLGTAMDFTTSKLDGGLEGFDKTPEYKWLSANAYKYGFVLSYPKGNTYYKFEPWHWRYVGIALATKLNENDMHFYDMDQRQIDAYLANIFD